MSKKRIILVHSIKGGCGKTTISLALARYFQKEYANTCYIDADIVGYGTSKMFNSTDPSGKKTFTDYLLLNPFENKDFFKLDFLDSVNKLVDEFIVINDGLKIIYSSIDNNKSEKAIRLTNDLFMMEEIKYKLSILLIALFSQQTIDTIVIDTTPGNQGLTAIIKGLITDLNEFQEKYSTPIKEILGDLKLETIDLFISTNNFAHIESLKNEEFKSDNTQVVLNQIPLGYDFSEIPNSEKILKDFDEIEKVFEALNPEGIKSFKKCLKDPGNDDTKITEAYKKYCIITSDSYRSELIPNKAIEMHLIPEIKSLRNDSADFIIGENNFFDKKNYFLTIDNELKIGFLKLLCESIAGSLKMDIH